MERKNGFDVKITSRHEELNPQIKDTILKQMLKLSKFHSHIIDGNVIFDRNNSYVKVEVSVRVPGLTITASHKDFNQIKAIDTAIEKTKTQIKKLKSKVADHRVSTQPLADEMSDTDEADVSI